MKHAFTKICASLLANSLCYGVMVFSLLWYENMLWLLAYVMVLPHVMVSFCSSVFFSLNFLHEALSPHLLLACSRARPGWLAHFACLFHCWRLFNRQFNGCENAKYTGETCKFQKTQTVTKS